MGLIGNLVGIISFTLFLKKYPTEVDVTIRINHFLKTTIWICFFVGGLFFIIMGMLYASFTLLLSTHIVKWLAIILVVIFLLVINTYIFKEVKSLNQKNILFLDFDFYHTNKKKYSNYTQVVNQNVLSGGLLLLPSYIFFLIFNELADKLSFGLNSFLLSFIK